MQPIEEYLLQLLRAHGQYDDVDSEEELYREPENVCWGPIIEIAIKKQLEQRTGHNVESYSIQNCEIRESKLV